MKRRTLSLASIALLAAGSLHASPPPRTIASGVYQPIGHELLHKVSMQTGYGPEDSALGNDRKGSYSVTYEPTFLWYSPEKRWAQWSFFGRANFTYESGLSSDSQASDNRNYDEQERPEHFYAELREFYLQRHLLGGDPRFSLSLGRRAFSDRYGIFWDDSIESLRLDYDDTFSRGFVAVAQKFWNYNSDVNSLSDREERTFYAMGEFAWRWQARQWAGVRTLYENDRSDNDPDDPQDFTGWRAGLFLRGDDLDSRWLSDYHLELAGLRGHTDSIDSRLNRERHDSSGAAIIGEFGKRFHALPWQPRLALHGGLTDSPDSDTDGFHLNRIQSDRVINPGSYNRRLVSSFIRLNLRNLAYYGAALELQPTPRSALDVRLSDLRLRNASGDLPLRTSQSEREQRRQAIRDGSFNGGRSIGQVLDINHYWKMFPLAHQQRHLNFSTLVNLSLFKAGSAVPSGDDYQLSFGIVATY